MRIDILTLFPDMFVPIRASILKRAEEKGLITINIFDIREYSKDRHKKCDDYPFGGGAGMVMTPQPIYDCIMSVDPDHEARRIYLSPKGRVLTQKIAEEYAELERILLLCGHYEGVDQRIIDLCIDEEVSIGDYILTGGEIPAIVLCDTICRLVKGVLGNEESVREESITSGMLEYPHYTRPQEFMGLSVPEILLSGHHLNIEKFRKSESEKITKNNRPDLIEE